MPSVIVLTETECVALAEHHRYAYLPNTDEGRTLFRLMQRIEARKADCTLHAYVTKGTDCTICGEVNA